MSESVSQCKRCGHSIRRSHFVSQTFHKGSLFCRVCGGYCPNVPITFEPTGLYCAAGVPVREEYAVRAGERRVWLVDNGPRTCHNGTAPVEENAGSVFTYCPEAYRIPKGAWEIAFEEDP